MKLRSLPFTFGLIGPSPRPTPPLELSRYPSLAIHCDTVQELTDMRRRCWGPGWFGNDRLIPPKRGKAAYRWCWP